MSDPTLFRIEHEHTEGIIPDYHEWVDLGEWGARNHGTEYEVRRDARGHRHRYGNYRWRLIVCNNPGCRGMARWRSDLVEDAARQWEADR